MQVKDIIKKAQSVGVGIDVNASDEENLHIIASSLGVDTTDLGVLNSKLNDLVAIKNEGNSSSGETVMTPSGNSTRFGENEYNAAKNENGVYDPDFYKKRQEELDDKLDAAKREKGNKWKKKDPSDKGPVAADGSNTTQKNIIDRTRDRMNLGKAKLDSISNNIASKKAAAFNATHPVEAAKNKAKAAVNKVKDDAKKKVRDALVSFIKKHPYVLLIAAGAFLLLLIIIIIVGSFVGAPSAQIDEYCNTKDEFGMSISSTPLSAQEFVDGAINYFEAHPNDWKKCQTVLNNRSALSTIYNTSLKNKVSPEVTLTRAIAEGCSPGTGIGMHTGTCQFDTNVPNRGIGEFTFDWNTSYNYWGIRTFEGTLGELHNDWSCNAMIYNNLEEAVEAFANIANKYDSVTAMMKVYAGEADEEQAREKARGMANIRNKIYYNENPDDVFNCSAYYANITGSSGSSLWWPIGGSEVTQEYGVEFAVGNPVSTRITATFGGNDSVHQGLGGGHGALDIGASRGSYVIATRDGVVTYPGPNDRIDYPDQAIRPDENGRYNCRGLKGNHVDIDHGDGLTAVYQHLYANTITVRKGDYVKKGQIIGKVGSSGCSTGPHLHFALKLNGTAVDPQKYVSGSNPRP
jgi:murein DD-endopeptidase MepM/ murein hydrolase activator NlpD